MTGQKPITEKQPTGRVVGIVKRNWRAYVCHIDRTSLASGASTSMSLQSVFAQPVSRSLPRIRLRTRQAPALLGQKILVSIDRWDVNSRYPEGHFVRALGQAESKEAEQESLLLEYDVPYRPFGKAILDCLPIEGDQWVVPPKDLSSPEWRDREDLRRLNVCSIDPPGEAYPTYMIIHPKITLSIGCQDIDDALHAMQLPNGNIEAGVRELLYLFNHCRILTRQQILLMFLILSFPIIRWTQKQLLVARPSISSTNVLTCFHRCWGQTSVLCGRM